MKKILFTLLSLVVIGSHQLSAGTVSFDQLAVSSDLTTTKYNSDLNTIYQKVNSNIQTDNIANDTVAEVDMADDANPRIRAAEGASCADFVYTGLLPSTTVGTLTGSIPSGTAYPDGYRVVKSSATPKTFTASRWTWIDLDINGDYQYSEVAIGGATPAVAANSVRLSRVSTDGTQIGAVLDLRNTNCFAGPFSILKDATGEASLGDIFANGGGIKFGADIISKDANEITVSPGSVYINGEYRTLTANLDVPIDTAASSTSGVSGRDTGAVGNSQTNYLYAAADVDGTSSFSGVFSTSASAPTSVTNYRRIAEVTTDASGSIVSADPTSISYVGKIKQIKRFQTGAVATGAVAIPYDDTVVKSTEGVEFMSLKFTPTSATSILKIDVVTNLSTAAGAPFDMTSALFVGTETSASAVGYNNSPNTDRAVNTAFTYYTLAGAATEKTYSVRCGNSTTDVTTFNGSGGGRKFGGTYYSSITITEYER